ncbi:glycosyltransferase family 87 protein [Hoyosella altamirensis]|uniref:Putative membrane protein n=1 Tax=Hoyosella altamirensis TaxID=616997 RepID=A0A839RPV7_9ACTN|nr:glycosyltransferase 87 family protein [Hoyosella altamirensis]MBB3038144.1 putative membrane protein [Hoyosella altamirensis]
MTAVRRHLPLIAVVLAAFSLLLAYLNKARCAGPVFSEFGRSENFDLYKNQLVCYSDIQLLWLGRDIDRHVFPFIEGGITPDGRLFGGTVEYPVLSGVLMWLGAIPSSNDAEFLFYSALLLTPFALLTAWMLAKLGGHRVLLFVATPALILYGFHNWELPVVFTAVAAIYVVTTAQTWSIRTRGIVAAVLLGIGLCLKLYPGIFVLPLALYVLTEGKRERGHFDFRGAISVAGAAVATVVAINAPFAIAGFEGWRASFEFQSLRRADITTNSIWYWGLLPRMEDETVYDAWVELLSPALILASFAVAAAVGWWIYHRHGTYPWVGVSAAMLCGFLLFHKVHSPQFALWLIPFFILLRVPWQLIGAYLLADIAIGIGVFRYFYDLGAGIDPSGGSELVTQVGVWGRAAGLVVFYVLFLRASYVPDESNTMSRDASPVDAYTKTSSP